MNKNTSETAFSFRWSYIGWPLVFLLLSIVMSAIFFPQLTDRVAYRFLSDGSPDKWLDKGQIVLWAVLPHLLLTIVAGGVTLTISGLADRFIQGENTWTKPGRIISIMGNMFALPQSILLFAVLDIFSYNSFQIHLLPLWVFALVILVVGGIILGIFFLRTVWQFWAASKE